ncbi:MULTISPECIES: polysaccharide deacetylase family protein [unclassified Paenibacillus]|uniref:polysaccharide deacetylase family protein n=1 Tax=unclassified Paenibacillus TaxID=185978 RepID=UPI0003F7B78F|nr:MULTISPECIES: polysaccharide deacetylase family protein [unclassified Paenibacillus]CDN44804.1 hypothetical protein BN871_FO_00080 [Paenibacillus sp. P22]
MSTVKRFWLLSAVLAFVLCLTAAGAAAVRYREHFPAVKRLLSEAPAMSEEAAGGEYKDLKPGERTPKGIYYRNKVIVLMYHDVQPTPSDTKALALDKLERQLELMRDNNFHVISMDEYKAFILKRKPVPDNAVLLTFDDGYESFYRYAYPVLLKNGLTATNFVIAGTIGNPKHAGVPKLTWEQMKAMRKHGMDFYSHTYDSHAYAPENAKGNRLVPLLAGRVYRSDLGRRETEKEYESRIREDLDHANRTLQKELGVRNDVLAFPYGAFSRPLLRTCKELGINVTLTVKPGMNGPGRGNGFRLNAGGAENDPELQIELMKQAPRLIGHNRYQPPDRAYLLLTLPLLVMFVGALWLRSAWEVIILRRKKLSLLPGKPS